MTTSSATAKAEEAISSFRQAAQLNRQDPLREGSILRLPGFGQAVMTGDLHGHRKNMEKLERYAMLDRLPSRHVILHEMVHEDRAPGHPDNSHLLSLEAARYKCRFPEQVHFLQSNHELAQLTGYPIAKNGRAVVEDFADAVHLTYGETHGPEVLAALNDFIASFPLAIVAPNRIWMSHSLPNVHDMPAFDTTIFTRALRPEDFADHGAVFKLVWGRRHTQEHIDALAKLLDVDTFIIGHQPQETGYAVLFDRLIILASDHNHGTFLPFDLSRPHTLEQLIRNIRKFVAVP
jgi:hypothetical protein